MSESSREQPQTNPRFSLKPPGAAEAESAILILAGAAQGRIPVNLSRVATVSTGLEIGRDRICAPWPGLCDPFMSRQHARIERTANGAHVLRDLGSTNGTWLGGLCLSAQGQRRLRDGDVVMAGGHVFVFRYVTEEERLALEDDWRDPFGPVPTLSPQVATFVRKLRRLSASEVDLLLTGETGAGKEVHAEAIHRHSGRKGPFLAINCAAIPENLVESELFGYARGAHSMADRPKPGLLEQAEGGTLFLDEIGEMPSTAQTKLLRFLQNREILSLGATRHRPLDVRVIAATHCSVEDAGRAGMRYDLAARLGPEPIAVPPLRDRVEDVGLLVSHLLGRGAGFTPRPAPVPVQTLGDSSPADWPSRPPLWGVASFEPEAYLALFLHNWKGNVRELDKVVAVAQVLAVDRATIDLAHLPIPIAARIEPRLSVRRSRRERPSRDELLTLLSRYNGDVARVAREIGRQRTLVWRWLRQESVRVEDYR